jgi:thiaminase (transcriptional activator TenA)
MDVFDRLKAAADWQSYVDHDFVRQMGAGTLPQAALPHLSRPGLPVPDSVFSSRVAYALATYKSLTLADMRAAQAGLAAILDEIDLHMRLCGPWGLSPDDIETAPEHQATVAYTRFVLDCGAAGDLHVALAPCVIGYAEIGRNVAPNGIDALGDHPYREWIAEYAGDAYQAVAASARRAETSLHNLAFAANDDERTIAH